MRRAMLLLLLVVQPLAAPAAQDRLDDRRISGRVVDTSGQPVAGAKVVLWTVSHRGSQTSQEVDATTTSAADGTFDFTGLFPTRYLIDAEAQHATSSLRVRQVNGEFARQASADVSFQGVAHASNVIVRVYPVGSLSGRVTRPDGTPVANAVVNIGPTPNAISDPEHAVRTDADGRYRVDRLPAGSYIVWTRYSARTDFEAQGRRVPPDYREFVDTFYPGTVKPLDATAVNVRAGEDTPQINIALAMSREFTILGRIADETGWAPAPLWLEWGSIDGEGFGHDDIGEYNGTFAIQGVSGEVGVLAKADTPKGVLIGMTTVRVTSASVRGVYIRLAPPARVRGRLIIEGGAQPPEHKYPPVGLRLRTRWPRVPCLSDTVHKAFPENDTAFMGEGGTFEFNEVIGERIFEVQGLAEGWRLKEVRHRGRVLPDHRLVLRARDLITDIEVFVATAPQPSR